MKTRNSERRTCRSLAPYLFLAFEVLVLSELAYIYTSILGIDSKFSIFFIIISLYFFVKSLNKMFSVLGRCKKKFILYKF